MLLAQQGALPQPDCKQELYFPPGGAGLSGGQTPTPKRFVPHSSGETPGFGGGTGGCLPGKGCRRPARMDELLLERSTQQAACLVGRPRGAAAPRAAGRGQAVPVSSRCPRVTPPPPAPRLIKGPRGSFLWRSRRPFPGEPALSISAGPRDLHLICERFNV